MAINLNGNDILNDLLKLFPASDYLQSCTFMDVRKMPAPYRELLVHEKHMTVTLEAHHGRLVDVLVQEKKHEGDSYARKILLRLQGSDRIVLFGLVRIHLHFCSPEVAAEIVSEKTPLGRVLIEHDVMRRIEPLGYLRIVPGPRMMDWFGLAEPQVMYGRT